MSTATSPPSIDLIRREQTRDLRQRPASTSLQLVHTEEITGLSTSAPQGREHDEHGQHHEHEDDDLRGYHRAARAGLSSRRSRCSRP